MGRSTPKAALVEKDRNPLVPSAQLFLKAESVRIGQLRLVYVGNVSRPHRKTYTSLSPKCLRLEIERTVSWADLLSTDGTSANEPEVSVGCFPMLRRSICWPLTSVLGGRAGGGACPSSVQCLQNCRVLAGR